MQIAYAKRQKDIAFRVVGIMQDHGYMSLPAQASALHVNVNTYRQYAEGTRKIPLDVIDRIRDLCGTSYDYIYGATDIKTGNQTIRQICKYTGLPESTVNWLHQIAVDSKAISIRDPETEAYRVLTSAANMQRVYDLLCSLFNVIDQTAIFTEIADCQQLDTAGQTIRQSNRVHNRVLCDYLIATLGKDIAEQLTDDNFVRSCLQRISPCID